MIRSPARYTLFSLRDALPIYGLVAQGKLQDALDAYQQGLAIAKRLAEQDKSNADWQRNLSLSYEKDGNSLRLQARLTYTLYAVQQCLTIAKRLAEQDKSNAAC